MFKGFAAFLARGNVIDLAVAVVIGGAFGAVVTALVKDLLTPLVNDSAFLYGDFLNALIAFASIAAAIYYIVVLPTQKLAELRRGPLETTVTACPECLSEISVAATRCKYCTAVVKPAVT
jgi:large conductance mechanosensitive channel